MLIWVFLIYCNCIVGRKRDRDSDKNRKIERFLNGEILLCFGNGGLKELVYYEIFIVFLKKMMFNKVYMIWFFIISYDL